MAPIPRVEIPKDGSTQSVRRPKAEHHPTDAIDLGEVSTHPLPDVVMVSFRKEMAIHLSHPFVTKGPRIILFVGDPSPLNPHFVVDARV